MGANFSSISTVLHQVDKCPYLYKFLKIWDITNIYMLVKGLVGNHFLPFFVFSFVLMETTTLYKFSLAYFTIKSSMCTTPFFGLLYASSLISCSINCQHLAMGWFVILAIMFQHVIDLLVHCWIISFLYVQQTWDRFVLWILGSSSSDFGLRNYKFTYKIQFYNLICYPYW